MTMEFITNRTQHNVDTLTRLRRKGWQNLSATERAEYLGNAALGAYNYTDLNRVESAVASISSTKNLGLVTKTNWDAWDTPTQSDMERYLGNVVAIQNIEIELIPETTMAPNSKIVIDGVDINSIFAGQTLAIYSDDVRYEATVNKDGDIYVASATIGNEYNSPIVMFQFIDTTLSVEIGSNGCTLSVFACGTSELAGIPIPNTMNGLNYESANNIEKVLEIAYGMVGPINNALGVARLGEIILS